MSKVSIIIPARAESSVNLNRTLADIYAKATGEFEVILGLDGSSEYPPYDIYGSSFNNMNIIDFPSVVGIKTNINAMASMATGEYLYKSDAHCSFSKGFDEIMVSDMQPNWIMMPRFKILTLDWEIQHRDGKEEFYDYFYLCCPFTDPRGFRFKAGGHWKERTQEREPENFISEQLVNDVRDINEAHPYIDETPQIHGSGWMITRKHYFELGGFPNIDPHGHAQEPIWLALKNWMWGGKVMVNKNCWYAHLHQQGNKRGYHMSREQEKLSYKIAAEYWMGDQYDDMAKGASIEWFVEKFWPMPTWPENWKELLKEWKHKNGYL